MRTILDKKKKIGKIISILACATIGVFVGVGASFWHDDVPTASALTCTTSETVAESYAYNSNFTIPSATISYNGEEVVATQSVIVFPNGATKTNTVRLDVEGEYTIIYYATVNGKTISAEKKFSVLKTTVDIVAPIIKLSIPDGVDAKVAKGEKVQIPQAVAMDENLVGEVAVNVYYAYGTEKESVVYVQDGFFTPQQIGLYAIEYTAMDAFGNSSTEILYFSCAVAPENISAKLTVEETATVEAGKTVNIPDVSLSGLYEGYDEYIKMYASFEGGERKEISSQAKFENVGIYEVVYELVTPLKTYTAVCQLEATASENVTFEKPILPKYLIKNAYHTLEDITAWTYKEKEPQKGVVEVYAIIDGNESNAQKIDYAGYKPQEGKCVQFLYKCGVHSLKSQVIPIVDVGYGDGAKFDIKEYFQGDFKKTANDELKAIVYTPNATEGTATMEYINPLSYNFFAFEFIVPNTGANNTIGAIVLTLTDYYDENNQIEFRFENNAGFMCYSMNGAKAIMSGKAFTDVSYTFKYDVQEEEFLVSGQYFKVQPLKSDKLFMSITIEDFKGENCQLGVRKVMNQVFDSSINSDKYSPKINAYDYTGLYEVGTIVDLAKVDVTDAVSPFYEMNFSLTVKDPDGRYVTTYDSGVLLDGSQTVESCQIQLTKYGEYLLEYYYYDQWGKKNEMAESFFFVEERIAPVIEIDGIEDGSIVEVAYLSKVTVANYTLEDNVSEVEKIVSFVEVYGPDYVHEILTDKTFFATKKGEYTVIYIAFDELGNIAVKTYIVRVV